MAREEIEIYTLQEIEDLMHVARRTLYNWIKAGKLKAFRVGKEWRVTREALNDFMNTGTGH